MNFLILGAMDEEIQTYLTDLENTSQQTIQHLDVNTGTINGHTVTVARCGIGKVAAAVAAGVLIAKFAPDLVINSGSAGGFADALNVGDIVIADSLVQHDVNLTHFGYALGQPAGMPERFTTGSNWHQKTLAEVAKLNILGLQGLIVSGDAFIGTDDQAKRIMHDFPDAVAVEMEGAAIAQTCYLLNTECLVIRAISDHANKESTVSFAEYLPLAAKHSAQIVLGLIQQA
jgi:adenosylhomocysteine nucleosidase